MPPRAAQQRTVRAPPRVDRCRASRIGDFTGGARPCPSRPIGSAGSSVLTRARECAENSTQRTPGALRSSSISAAPGELLARISWAPKKGHGNRTAGSPNEPRHRDRQRQLRRDLAEHRDLAHDAWGSRARRGKRKAQRSSTSRARVVPALGGRARASQFEHEPRSTSGRGQVRRMVSDSVPPRRLREECGTSPSPASLASQLVAEREDLERASWSSSLARWGASIRG